MGDGIDVEEEVGEVRDLVRAGAVALGGGDEVEAEVERKVGEVVDQEVEGFGCMGDAARGAAGPER